MDAQWYVGICDTVLGKLTIWQKNYLRGEIYATRKALSGQGKPIDVPVKYLHRMAWTRAELEHLERMLAAAEGGKLLAAEIQGVISIWSQGLLLSHKQRIVSLAFYPEHVDQMVQLVTNTKHQYQNQEAEDIEGLIEQSHRGGKSLFET